MTNDQATDLVNARVALDPETLETEVHQIVNAACRELGARADWHQTQSSRPGRPVPTHRFADAVPESDGFSLAFRYSVRRCRPMPSSRMFPKLRLPEDSYFLPEAANTVDPLDIALAVNSSLACHRDEIYRS